MESGELSVPKIMEIDWERRFQPLTQEDVVDIWDKLLLSMGKASGSQYETLQRYLFELCDRDQLTFVGIKDGLPRIKCSKNINRISNSRNNTYVQALQMLQLPEQQPRAGKCERLYF